MRENTTNNIVSNVIVAFSVLLALCRCFSINNVATFFVCVISIGFCLLLRRGLTLCLLDTLVILGFLVALLHKYEYYPWKDFGFYFLALLLFFSARDSSNIKAALYAVAVFSIINLGVNLLNIVSPGLYNSIIDLVLQPQLSNDVRNQMTQGYLCGLSDHYSRNAFFCVAGGSILFSFVFSKYKKGWLVYVCAAIQIAMIMIIGKRGHFVFLLAALFITYALIAPSISKSIINTIGITCSLLVAAGVLFEVYPSAFHVLDRFAYFRSSGDISNGRYYLWKTAIELFKEKPIFGHGYGYFSSTYRSGVLKGFFAGVHNDYIQWLCEMGIVGFVINIAISVILYVISIKELKRIVKVKRADSKLSEMLIIWSVMFQTFILLYSLTGLPHFDFEINVIYYISLAVPIIMLKHPACEDLQINKVNLKW